MTPSSGLSIKQPARPGVAHLRIEDGFRQRCQAFADGLLHGFQRLRPVVFGVFPGMQVF